MKEIWVKEKWCRRAIKVDSIKKVTKTYYVCGNVSFDEGCVERVSQKEAKKINLENVYKDIERYRKEKRELEKKIQALLKKEWDLV